MTASLWVKARRWVNNYIDNMGATSGLEEYLYILAFELVDLDTGTSECRLDLLLITQPNRTLITI